MTFILAWKIPISPLVELPDSGLKSLICGQTCCFGATLAGGGCKMNFERYTDRAKGFVQSAQSLALRENHQQFTPEHLLKVLLDDSEGLAAGLISRAGGEPKQALDEVEAALAKRPKVTGGNGQLYLSSEMAQGLRAGRETRRQGRGFVRDQRAAVARVDGRKQQRSRPGFLHGHKSMRRHSMQPSTRSAKAARPTPFRPKRATTRSRNTRAI